MLRRGQRWPGGGRARRAWGGDGWDDSSQSKASHSLQKMRPSISACTARCSPFPTKVLSDDGRESFYASDDGTVDHDWSLTVCDLLGLVGGSGHASLAGSVGELELDWQLEVELNRSALVATLERVLNGDVDLWTESGHAEVAVLDGLPPLQTRGFPSHGS